MSGNTHECDIRKLSVKLEQENSHKRSVRRQAASVLLRATLARRKTRPVCFA